MSWSLLEKRKRKCLFLCLEPSFDGRPIVGRLYFVDRWDVGRFCCSHVWMVNIQIRCSILASTWLDRLDVLFSSKWALFHENSIVENHICFWSLITESNEETSSSETGFDHDEKIVTIYFVRLLFFSDYTPFWTFLKMFFNVHITFRRPMRLDPSVKGCFD